LQPPLAPAGEEKGGFRFAGEKVQNAVSYASEKLQNAGTFVVDTAVAAKEKVVCPTPNAEHTTASGTRAAKKMDPK
jgi:hypothetical protein